MAKKRWQGQWRGQRRAHTHTHTHTYRQVRQAAHGAHVLDGVVVQAQAGEPVEAHQVLDAAQPLEGQHQARDSGRQVDQIGLSVGSAGVS